MYVHRLLDKAKKVIARENKNLQRETTLTEKKFAKSKTSNLNQAKRI